MKISHKTAEKKSGDSDWQHHYYLGKDRSGNKIDSITARYAEEGLILYLYAYVLLKT